MLIWAALLFWQRTKPARLRRIAQRRVARIRDSQALADQELRYLTHQTLAAMRPEIRRRGHQ